MNQTTTPGRHRARITLASLMSRLTGVADGRSLAMPRAFSNIEQLRDAVEGQENERQVAAGFTPRHRHDVDARVETVRSAVDKRALRSVGRW